MQGAMHLGHLHQARAFRHKGLVFAAQHQHREGILEKRGRVASNGHDRGPATGVGAGPEPHFLHKGSWLKTAGLRGFCLQSVTHTSTSDCKCRSRSADYVGIQRIGFGIAVLQGFALVPCFRGFHWPAVRFKDHSQRPKIWK